MDYDNTNRGTLFTNDRKTTSKHPDYTGRINIDGVDYWLSDWLNESRQGKKYISLNTKKVDDGKDLSKPPSGSNDYDDDIPF